MPEIQLPFSTGLVTDAGQGNEADWLDALPVNMLAVPKPVLGARGYMHSWPGLVKKLDTVGRARGGIANDAVDDVFRIQGTKLINRAGDVLADVGISPEHLRNIGNVEGVGYAPTAFSRTTTAIVSNGRLLFWDGDELTQLRNWSENEFGPNRPATNFNIGTVIDVTRNRGRYIWISDNSGLFGVTDITNEQRPDYIAPFYSAETEPDENLGVDNWRNYVVVFGRFTIEYFQLTGSTETIYQAVNSLTVRCGIIGTGAYCRFFDTFAVVGSPRLEPVSVFIIDQGQYTEIATRRVQKIFQEYTEEELSTVYMEPIKYDAHDMIIIHLPRHTLVYDHSASSAGQRNWTILKSDVNGDTPYRGIYHIVDNQQFYAGDKQDPIISKLDKNVGSHIGEPIEYILFSHMAQLRNVRIMDLQVDSIPGSSNEAYRLAISVTYDGVSYQQEQWIDFDSPKNYTDRVLLRRLGYSQNNIGYKVRWVSSTPSSISNLRIRYE